MSLINVLPLSAPPAPLGVDRRWERCSMEVGNAGDIMRRYHVPATWGDPASCWAWFDSAGAARCILAHYTGGRSATYRADKRGSWKMEFGS